MKDAARRDRERWTQMAEELAGLGYWRYDLKTRAARWSPGMYRIYGFERGGPGPGEPGLARIHPDDRPEADARLAAAMAGEPGVTLTRVVWPDGTVRHTEGRIACEHGEDGEVVAIFGAVLDVTERRREQEELARHEAHLQILADNGGDVIIEVDAEHHLQRVSSAIRRYGYEPDALVGRPIYDLLHRDDTGRLRTIAEELLRGGPIASDRNRTYRLQTADGGEVWVEGSPTLIHAADGGVEGVISVVRDITERRAAALALAEREAQLRLISEHTRDVVLQYDLDHTILYVSPAVRRYGYEPEELIGRPAPELLHPEDRGKVAAMVANLFSSGAVEADVDRSHRVRAKSGDYVWMEGRPVIVRDEAGKPLSVVSLLHDVTERRAADEALAESERRYRLLADNVTDIVSRASIEGRFRYLSPAVLDVTGYRADELHGKSLLPLIHAEDIAGAMAYYASATDGTRPEGLPVVYRARHKAGHWIWLESTPTVLRDETGAPVEFIAVLRDVTARHSLEAELREARDAAEAAAAAKSEFLANMSHEIRTPLTAVLGYASLLTGRDDLDPVARGHVARIASAGRGLLALVNDVLDFSKLEAGHVEVRPAPTDPAALAGEVLDMAAFQAGAKGLDLRLEAAPDLPACLSVDPKLVSQVLINLVGNGVKFTDTGGVTLALDYDPAAQALAVVVRDTGAGLTAEQAARLFQRFSQVDGSATRRHGGTGLGLAICKGLVEAMGGTIGVESAPGAGAAFRFVIPAPVAQPLRPAETGAQTFDPSGVRLLVIDDNPVNCELVAALLAPLGVEVATADGGLAGLELAAGQPFDIILTDIRMPDVDGHEVLARVRGHEGPNQDIPILAFSADVDVHGESALAFDGHIRKPLEPGALLQAIFHWAAAWPLDEEANADAA